MPQLIGRTVVAVDPVARCGNCGERASQISKLWDEVLRGGEIQDMWVFVASVVSEDAGRVSQVSVIVVPNAS